MIVQGVGYAIQCVLTWQLSWGIRVDNIVHKVHKCDKMPEENWIDYQVWNGAGSWNIGLLDDDHGGYAFAFDIVVCPWCRKELED